ncbi:MAG: hypothetical protein P8165_07655 [Deltaproteobacteria bacterium]|jgi:hypothetical protein
MAKYAGLWIDHKKAVIVSIEEAQPHMVHIASEVERHVRVKGGSRTSTPYGPQDVVSEKKRDEKYKRQLRDYYQEVIGAIQEARKIFIFGPGEAKIELEAEMEKKKGLRDKIVGIEPADKMTEAQILAQVKKFYGVTSDHRSETSR